MQEILAALRELEGVRGAFICTPAGGVVRHHCRAAHDESLLRDAGSSLVRAIDSIALRHSDWEEISAEYSGGELLIRNLGGAFLGVIADASLNASFAGVAIRVAATKLKQQIASGALTRPGPADARRPSGGRKR